jgi:WD40 repeat protein
VNALSLHYHRNVDQSNSSSSTLLFSTDSGNICVFQFDEDQLAKMAIRQKGAVEHFVIEKEGQSKLKGLGSLWKRKCHNDWATKINYFPDLHMIISCSPDPKESLSILELDVNQKWHHHSAAINKGVHTFAFSKNPILIVTGGMDRQIRIWNPHKIASPTATLSGHTASIVDIVVNEVHGHIISLSADKVIKVWDSRRHTCLQSISNTQRQLPEDTLTNIYFVSDFGGSILSSSNTLYQYRLTQKIEIRTHPTTHDYPVRCHAYNSTFHNLVTACDGGDIHVWDLQTGHRTFRFALSEKKEEITATAFDTLGKRLITGTRSGNVNIWNYNNGELLQRLSITSRSEITRILVQLTNNSIFRSKIWLIF